METTCSAAALFNLVAALSQAMDMVSPLVMDHHKRTAWFAMKISEELGMSPNEINEVVFAALLHDIGAFSLQERFETLRYKFENPHHYACPGYNLLKDCELLREEARIILAHHTWWEPELDENIGGQDVPAASHVIHPADRTAILLGDKACYLEDRLYSNIDPRFLESKPIELKPIAQVFARIIDYKSHFTATHSAGVAAVAEILAEYPGFSENNCRMMKIAGYLHDLGKIAIPTEILDKSERPDPGEYNNRAVAQSQSLSIWKDIEQKR